MEAIRQQYLRKIPSVDQLLLLPEIKEMEAGYSRKVLVENVRQVLGTVREQVLRYPVEQLGNLQIDQAVFLKKIQASLSKAQEPSLRRAINATGVILHTNLGRAPLGKAALAQIMEVAGSYSTLEINVETGIRGSRYSHVEGLLCQLTGAEAALVVNNNAAAVLLALNTLAKGKEVIISRGQLVEIGGAFRIPEVMEQSGARLKEVGATNKTYLRDYEQAISQDTALLLKVHTSNYRILGFTAEASLEELVELGRKHNLPVMDDLGSGVLIDLGEYNLLDEPTVANRIQTGVDVVTFSGDKLLGGPQAGIIVGKAPYINAMKKNPLTRALRIDKLSLAALEATLRAYQDPQKAVSTIPFWEMLTAPCSVLEKRAGEMAKKLGEIIGDLGQVALEAGVSKAGGGSLPLEEFPTFLVTFSPSTASVEKWEERLRQNNPPVFTRIQKEKILLDPRTISKGEEAEIYQAFQSLKGEL